MSGGRWLHQERTLVEKFWWVQKIPAIMDALEEALHLIDLAESNDSSRPEEEKKVYDILLKLGDDIFG